MSSVEVLQAIMATAQIYGRQFSPETAKVFAGDLSSFDDAMILRALSKCRIELRTFPTVADIISRIDDGRPGPEEAWAMMPKSEDDSIVWTDEMQAAYSVYSGLKEDQIAARMAFKETYTKLVAQAREQNTPVKWTPSLGFSKPGRIQALREAVEKGRMTQDAAVKLIPTGHEDSAQRIGGIAQINSLMEKHFRISEK